MDKNSHRSPPLSPTFQNERLDSKERQISGDSNKSDKSIGRLTPTFVPHTGVRTKLTPHAPTPKPPASVEYKVGAKLECYDYGHGKTAEGDLIFDWWKCSIVETRISEDGYRQIKLRYKGYKNDKWDTWCAWDHNE